MNDQRVILNTSEYVHGMTQCGVAVNPHLSWKTVGLGNEHCEIIGKVTHADRPQGNRMARTALE